MNKKHSKTYWVLSAIISLLLAACSPQQPTATPTESALESTSTPESVEPATITPEPTTIPTDTPESLVERVPPEDLLAELEWGVGGGGGQGFCPDRFDQTLQIVTADEMVVRGDSYTLESIDGIDPLFGGRITVPYVCVTSAALDSVTITGPDGQRVEPATYPMPVIGVGVLLPPEAYILPGDWVIEVGDMAQSVTFIMPPPPDQLWTYTDHVNNVVYLFGFEPHERVAVMNAKQHYTYGQVGEDGRGQIALPDNFEPFQIVAVGEFGSVVYGRSISTVPDDIDTQLVDYVWGDGPANTTRRPDWSQSYFCTNGPCFELGSTTAYQSIDNIVDDMYVRWEYIGMQPDMPYTVSWYRDGDLWTAYRCAWGGPEYGAFNTTLTVDDGIPAGEWILEITVDDTYTFADSIVINNRILNADAPGQSTDCPDW